MMELIFDRLLILSKSYEGPESWFGLEIPVKKQGVVGPTSHRPVIQP